MNLLSQSGSWKSKIKASAYSVSDEHIILKDSSVFAVSFLGGSKELTFWGLFY